MESSRRVNMKKCISDDILPHMWHSAQLQIFFIGTEKEPECSVSWASCHMISYIQPRGFVFLNKLAIICLFKYNFCDT